MNRILIGTSGWVYSHWRGLFYPDDLPEKRWLEYYAKNFSAVELNASFYHLPKGKTFQNWYTQTPADFVFAIKGSRFITHVKKISDCRVPLTNLLQAASNLREKLGPIFFQFPPSLKADKQRLENFLELLSSTLQVKRDWHFAFEFRHFSWFCEEIYSLLRGANCALIASDAPDYPYEEVRTADFMYLRLHGHEEIYASKYSEAQLKEYAGKIKNWLRSGKVFVFFNNDANANAAENAKDLIKLINLEEARVRKH